MKPQTTFFRLAERMFFVPQDIRKAKSLRFAQSFLIDGTFIYRALYTITNLVFYIVKNHYYRNKNPIDKIS